MKTSDLDHASASRRALDWLLAYPNRESALPDLVVALYMCEEILGLTDHRHAKALLYDVIQSPTYLPTALQLELMHNTPINIYLFTQILDELDVKYHWLGELWRTIAATLTETGKVDAEETIVTKLILGKIGVLDALPWQPADWAADLGEALFYKNHQITLLCEKLEVASEFGHTTLNLPSEEAQKLELLWCIWLVDYFQLYNLHLGARILRCMKYCDAMHRWEYAAGLGFLAAQQQENGSFGYFGPELHWLSAIRDIDRQIANLHLATTCQAIHTLYVDCRSTHS